MRPSTSQILNITANATAPSKTIFATDVVRISFQYVSTATINGTLQIQVSNDIPTGASPQTFVPTNWANLGTATTVNSAGVTNTGYIECSYGYIRVLFTDSSSGSSTGTIQVNAAVKSL